METIQLHLPDGRLSNIHVGEGLHNILWYTDNRKKIIITEENIYKLYKNNFPPKVPVVCIEGGEWNKSLATVEKITELLIGLGADRECFVIGVGGGIVCDITGFIASIFMRGLRFGFVATTLLAQVDASVGGKNGVNFNSYKNMLGVFNQPDFVLCDTGSLKTVPQREFLAGLAEVVKTALIADKNLFEFLESNKDKILALDENSINYIVKRCVEIKAETVSNDEREKGERRKLNLGHTFGHAIEKHGDLLHGEAVSIGMVIAAKISHKLGYLRNDELNRITDLLHSFSLPTSTEIDKTLLLDAITKDKKKENQSLHFIINDGIGNVQVINICFDELNKTFLHI